MAEKDENELEQSEEKKGSSKLLLIIIAIVLVLILIIGGIIAVLLMSNNDAAPQQTQEQASTQQNSSKSYDDGSLTEVGIMYPLDTFTVNLLSESGRRYLKCELNLEMEGKELSPELDTKKPVFRDTIIRLLSSKSLEEISTAKGKERLKEQIVNELNTRLKDGKVRNVYFTDFVVQ